MKKFFLAVLSAAAIGGVGPAARAQAGFIDALFLPASTTLSADSIGFDVYWRAGTSYGVSPLNNWNAANMYFNINWTVTSGTPVLGGSKFSDVNPTYLDVTTPATQNSIPGAVPTGYDVELGITMTRTGSQLDLPSSYVKMLTVKIKVNGGTVSPIDVLSDLQLRTGNPPTVQQSSWSNTTGATSQPFMQSPGTALSTSLLPLTARKAGGTQVQLDWATASESGIDRFTAERSADGQSFDGAVATVPAVGESSTKQAYRAFDAAPIQGTGYYRIKMWDRAGGFRLSNVVAVSFSSTGESILVYPTDNHDGAIHVDLPASYAGAEIEILNLAGQLVQRAATAASVGVNTVQIPGGAAEGLYLVRVTVADGATETFKVSYRP